METWANANVGGLLDIDDMCGVCGPVDDTNVSALYDAAFDRFQTITNIGKKKYQGRVLNTAQDRDELIRHAVISKPAFIAFLDIFSGQAAGIHYSSGGIDNIHMVKNEQGLDFKLRYSAPGKVSDMLRTTFVCPSITSLHDSITRFRVYCEESGLDYQMFSFYDSVARFGAEDRANEQAATPFGYVGVHFTVAMTIPQPQTAVCMCKSQHHGDTDGASCTCAEPSSASVTNTNAPTHPHPPTTSDPITLQVEVQFHPHTIYDGTDSCLKERLHPVYKLFTHREIQANAGRCRQARKAVEMHVAYAMASTPM